MTSRFVTGATLFLSVFILTDSVIKIMKNILVEDKIFLQKRKEVLYKSYFTVKSLDNRKKYWLSKENSQTSAKLNYGTGFKLQQHGK
jgi:hypothetical protein